jgi:hypothetical protein
MPDGFMDDSMVPPEGANPPKDGPKRVKRLVRRIDTPTTRTREHSAISFPYQDLEAGISVAAAIMQSGGVALSRDQLAGTMKMSPGSGAFILKVSTARLFGVVGTTQGKYELTQLGFSILDSDEKRQRLARAAAFLNVPLYRRVYDEFKGKQLPPRPHGLEQAFLKFGVAAKQRANARIAFERSARQAGFFASGDDRLIEPIIGHTLRQDRPAVDLPADEINGYPSGKPEMTNLHPFIKGLLDTLPEPGTNWALEGRAKWLQAAAYNFDLMYKGGDGEIKVSALIESKVTKTC